MRNRRIVWTSGASEDLSSIIEFISQDNIQSAISSAQRIEMKVRLLVQFPHLGHKIPELHHKSHRNLREIIVSPWRIVYKVLPETIYILAVIDSRRDT